MAMTIVMVEWIDASYQDGDITLSQMSQLLPLQTVGWLVLETKDAVSVAAEYCEKEQTFRHVSHIPRVGIKQIRRLK